ncbi:MAG: hypothetical protein IH892_17880 [Planctomycetes bacterium]|nr:hypothetical protein [Planctomycetota bacterium]
MVKAQVQIPDEFYHRAKGTAFAEVERRGVEYMASVHPREVDEAREFPVPGRCK